MNVGTWAEAVDSLLLSATTYSFWCLRSIREKAKTPGPRRGVAHLLSAVAQGRVCIGDRGQRL